MEASWLSRRGVAGGLLLALATLGVIVAGCDDHQAQRPAPPPPEVGVVTLQPRPFALTTELPGRVHAVRVAEVRPQVSGILQQRLFDEGAAVKAGQVLYRIDPARYQAAVARAEGELARAEASEQVAHLKAERYMNLVRKGAVTQQENDDVQALWRQARAQVQAARAALRSARIDLGYTRIQAPIDGRVSASFVTEGALVTAGQPQMLARITQLDPIHVDIQRPSAELLRLRRELASGHLEQVGKQAVQVGLLLADGTPYALRGRLDFSDVTVDPGSASVTLRATFANPDRLLLPGMYVRAQFKEATIPQALLVPQRAVSRDTEGGASVLLVKADNTIELRHIETRRAVGKDWLVERGLAPGDRVVVSRPLRLAPGQAVKPVARDLAGAATPPNPPG